jgi:hypothetical protein
MAVLSVASAGAPAYNLDSTAQLSQLPRPTGVRVRPRVWDSRDDGLAGAYGCNGESAVLAPFQAAGWDLAAIIDRSSPQWTVKVGPLRTGKLPPPQTLTVTTAWFAGN